MANPAPIPVVAAPQGSMLDVLLSNPSHAWIVAGATLFVLLASVFILKRLVLTHLERAAKATAVHWDDLIVDLLRRIKVWLIFPALVYASVQSLALPGAIDKWLRVLALIGVGIQFLLSAQRLVDEALRLLVKRARGQDGSPDPTIASSVGVIRVLTIGLIAVLVVLVTLDNLGFSITSLITGLGIGGVAVALAAQSILGDLFASVCILLDRPFVVGDFIVVGDKMGTVERIGVKTTRLRSLGGEQLVFGNSDLLSSRVQNFKRMQERRIVFTVGVTYETPIDKLRALPQIIREAILKQQGTRFDRAHFKSFGAYSLDFEAAYYVLSADYNVYMDTQQAINLELMDRFAGQGVEFAYPTSVQNVRINPPPAQTAPGPHG